VHTVWSFIEVIAKSILFYFAFTHAQVHPQSTPLNCKAPRLSVVNHLTCCFAILILVLQCKHECSKNKCSTQMHTSKLWLLRMRKVKAPTWMKLLSTKNYINGPKLGTKFISPWV
jgi:hypothetical protein